MQNGWVPKQPIEHIPPEGKFEWKSEWNFYIVEAIEKFGAVLLDNEAVPKEEMTELCPGFFRAKNGEKEAFWALFIASIARYESGFDPNSRMREDASLGYVYSEGLLQLSYGDEENYRHCNLDRAAGNILDPKTNLQCGVEILSKQISAKPALFTNEFFYWSVLSDKKIQIRKQLQVEQNQLAFCKP